MTRYTPGDWITYRNAHAITASGKVLEIRPDDYLVVGTHENDPDPAIVNPDDVTGYVE